jgi:hypothetical protein
MVRCNQLLGVVTKLPPCTIGTTACNGAHHWARQFERFGHSGRELEPLGMFPSGLVDESIATKTGCSFAVRTLVPPEVSAWRWTDSEPIPRRIAAQFVRAWYCLTGGDALVV